MSTTLFFLAPVGLLAVTWSLCVVGCALHTHGQGLLTPYSNTILDEPTLLAYWPLSDSPGAAPPPPFPPTPQGSTSFGTAIDLSGEGHPGSYLIPPLYASGTTFLKDSSPALLLRQASIVPGDISESGTADQNLLPACVDFEGGYVSIPWGPNSPKLDEFTLEAWIKPKWNDSGFNWVVFDAQTATAGFGLYIDTSNQWVLSVGDGATIQTISTMIGADVNGALTYVAVTFKSSTQVLSLWINPPSDAGEPPPTPNWPPMPDQTTNYVAVDPTQAVTFFIGAGATQLPLRTQDGDPNGAPLAPFQGFIQNVALYQTALDPADLASHYFNGLSTS